MGNVAFIFQKNRDRAPGSGLTLTVPVPPHPIAQRCPQGALGQGGPGLPHLKPQSTQQGSGNQAALSIPDWKGPSRTECPRPPRWTAPSLQRPGLPWSTQRANPVPQEFPRRTHKGISQTDRQPPQTGRVTEHRCLPGGSRAASEPPHHSAGTGRLPLL